jgi:hypothetical protein
MMDTNGDIHHFSRYPRGKQLLPVGAYFDGRGLNVLKNRRVLATAGNETSFSVHTVHFLFAASPV